ncbi:hypothetical protein LAZ67_23001112 [Cordylochernes scorpioides]|uniref:Uncharacterized protein n=1 Tax=Cordylochernes scorpioides TaxID=51811 RepID=A0ABY6LQK5_9ARAC|nr:hypothetical protein LAZ67_23001112 [Cordylochernes scorpioides]
MQGDRYLGLQIYFSSYLHIWTSTITLSGGNILVLNIAPTLGCAGCFGSSSIFTYLKKMDQRTCIKFCVKNEIKCADAFRMLTVAFGEATLDRSNVYR